MINERSRKHKDLAILSRGLQRNLSVTQTVTPMVYFRQSRRLAGNSLRKFTPGRVKFDARAAKFILSRPEVHDGKGQLLPKRNAKPFANGRIVNHSFTS